MLKLSVSLLFKIEIFMTGNDESNFLNRPFSERLAKGESRMTILSFELSVLQIYRDDPRYSYNSTDFSNCFALAFSLASSHINFHCGTFLSSCLIVWAEVTKIAGTGS